MQTTKGWKLNSAGSFRSLLDLEAGLPAAGPWCFHFDHQYLAKRSSADVMSIAYLLELLGSEAKIAHA